MEGVIREIESEIRVIERSRALYEDTGFVGRAEAIDHLESSIIEPVERLLLSRRQVEELEELQALLKGAEKVKSQLEEIDRNLFLKLRASIRSGHFTGAELERHIGGYVGCTSTERLQNDRGYDSLDEFVSGMLLVEDAPGETKEREPEMVFYQPTPARIVFELLQKANFKDEDVFYDLGSGLGQVAILVNLLGGVRAKGVEFEPAFCEYARRCAEGLNLSRVEFLNVDAREADYSDGTVFFMYTPFEGRILQEVLEKLKAESGKREIRIGTYGPCTQQVSRQRWVEPLDQNGDSVDMLAMFRNT